MWLDWMCLHDYFLFLLLAALRNFKFVFGFYVFITWKLEPKISFWLLKLLLMLFLDLVEVGFQFLRTKDSTFNVFDWISQVYLCCLSYFVEHEIDHREILIYNMTWGSWIPCSWVSSLVFEKLLQTGACSVSFSRAIFCFHVKTCSVGYFEKQAHIVFWEWK